MRTTILISLSCVSLIAVVIDLLIIRPISPPAGGPAVHVALVRGIDVPKTVKVAGDTIVGFSCIDVSGGVACYIASR